MKSTQNFSPGRFWHAEAESEVKNLQNFHPDLEMKENDLQIFFINPFVGLCLSVWTSGLAIFDLKFRFCMSKSSPGTISEVIQLDADLEKQTHVENRPI